MEQFTKENTVKKTIWFSVILTVLLLLMVSVSFACVGAACKKESNIGDINDGQPGNILTYYCEKGAESLGKWTDPKDIPELKGEDGKDGYTPIKGVDYFDGLNGKDGIGKDGTNGVDGKTPVKNVDYFDGLNGINGTNGKDVDPKLVNSLTEKNNEQDNRLNNVEKRISQLEKTQYKFQTELRIIDTKRLTVSSYVSQNYTRSGMVDEAGIRVVIKVGKSYEETMIEKTNKRLSTIEKKLGNVVMMERIVDQTGKTISMNIGSVAVETTF
jgi:hypothetical protein